MQFSELRTLWAMINASPRALRVYRTFKQTILSQIAQNALPPAILRIAIDAYEQREKYKGDKRRDPTAVLTYLRERFFPRDALPLTREGETLPPETSIGVLRFNETVEYFISDFTDDRLALLEEFLRSSGKRSELGAVLSPTEHFRLSRAFYLLELFGQLFFAASPSSENNPSVFEQATPFLEHLRDFELEELLCVRSYLLDKLIGYLSQVEDEFMHEYMERELYKIEPDDASCRWEHDDRFFSMDGHHDLQNWLEDCLTAGLDSIRAMVTADTMDDRFYNLRNTFFPQGIWITALNTMPIYPDSQIQQPREIESLGKGFSDDVDRGNAGWLRALSYGYHPRESSDYADNLSSSRRWGYAIWDYNRLLSSNLIEW